jgi:hypothetical protein
MCDTENEAILCDKVEDKLGKAHGKEDVSRKQEGARMMAP